jgi:RimJ/RimL family protein N-acetyltransferase
VAVFSEKKFPILDLPKSNTNRRDATMPITLRQIQPSDRDAWQDLYFRYLEFYESQPIDSSTELVWARLTSGSPEIQGLVAEDNGEIVGFTHFHFQLSTWTHTWHCYLEDLFVAEHSRGKGVATALIQAVKDRAVQRKCSELYWITRAGNETARRVYDKVAKATDFVRYEILLDQ